MKLKSLTTILLFSFLASVCNAQYYRKYTESGSAQVSYASATATSHSIQQMVELPVSSQKLTITNIYNSTTNDHDMVIGKFSSSGSLINLFRYNDASNSMIARSIMLYSSTEVIIACTYKNPSFSDKIVLINFNFSTMLVTWAKTYAFSLSGTGYLAESMNLCKANNGTDILVSALFSHTNIASGIHYLGSMKVTSTGVFGSMQCYRLPFSDFNLSSSSIIPMPDLGRYAIIGTIFMLTPVVDYDVFVFEINESLLPVSSFVRLDLNTIAQYPVTAQDMEPSGYYNASESALYIAFGSIISSHCDVQKDFLTVAKFNTSLALLSKNVYSRNLIMNYSSNSLVRNADGSHSIGGSILNWTTGKYNAYYFKTNTTYAPVTFKIFDTGNDAKRFDMEYDNVLGKYNYFGYKGLTTAVDAFTSFVVAQTDNGVVHPCYENAPLTEETLNINLYTSTVSVTKLAVTRSDLTIQKVNITTIVEHCGVGGGGGKWEGDDEQNTTTESEPFSFSVFPNPSNDFINIALNQITAEEQSIELRDLTGRIIQELVWNPASNTGFDLQLNLKELNSGMYTITMSNSTGTYTKRIMKE